MPPLVSAIVLNYKTPKDTIRCVRALLHQTIADDIEILVVDNRSEDDSIGLLRNTFQRVTLSGVEGRHSNDQWFVSAHPDTEHFRSQVRFLETPRNRGYGQGNAEAAKRASGRFLLIINPDNELQPDGLARMTTAMEADEGIGIMGPKLIHEDGTIRDSYRTFPTIMDVFIKRTFLRKYFTARMRRYLQHGQDSTQVRDIDWLAGACLLIRRDFFDQLGGFDPRFFLFFEDTDLCRRCWSAGKRVVYFPLAYATDRKHRLSEGGFLSLFTKRTMRIHLASAIRYFWKWRREKLPKLV